MTVQCERPRTCEFLVSSCGIRHYTLVLFFSCSRPSSCFGHWYLFWSVVVASAFTGTRFPGVHCFRHLEVCKSPWSLRGSRVYAPHGCMGLMAAYAACCTPYIRHFPLVPVQRWSIELPATTVGEWRRRRSLRRHKGGLWTVPFTFCHHVSLQGGF